MLRIAERRSRFRPQRRQTARAASDFKVDEIAEERSKKARVFNEGFFAPPPARRDRTEAGVFVIAMLGRDS
ncbi:MAG TPA: hypothetical protein VF702_00665 [Allosphingosinicella sp.]|jgi:hypothetical protein